MVVAVIEDLDSRFRRLGHLESNPPSTRNAHREPLPPLQSLHAQNKKIFDVYEVRDGLRIRQSANDAVDSVRVFGSYASPVAVGAVSRKAFVPDVLSISHLLGGFCRFDLQAQTNEVVRRSHERSHGRRRDRHIRH